MRLPVSPLISASLPCDPRRHGQCNQDGSQPDERRHHAKAISTANHQPKQRTGCISPDQGRKAYTGTVRQIQSHPYWNRKKRKGNTPGKRKGRSFTVQLTNPLRHGMRTGDDHQQSDKREQRRTGKSKGQSPRTGKTRKGSEFRPITPTHKKARFSGLFTQSQNPLVRPAARGSAARNKKRSAWPSAFATGWPG